MDLGKIKTLISDKNTELSELEKIYEKLNDRFEDIFDDYDLDDEKNDIEELIAEIVTHPNIDENLLIEISHISSFYVLDYLVKNPKISFSFVKEIMYEENNDFLNLQALEHPDVTREVLEDFLEHHREDIREKAKEKLDKL